MASTEEDIREKKRLSELDSVMSGLLERMQSFKDAIINIMLEKAKMQEGKEKDEVIATVNNIIEKFGSAGGERYQELYRSGGMHDTKRYLSNYTQELVDALHSSVAGFESLDHEKIFKQIMDAENLNNFKKRNPVVTVTDANGVVIGRSSPDGVFHAKGEDGAWKDYASKDEMMNAVYAANKGAQIYTRTESPITQFTKAQEAEWMKILKKEDGQPKWFKALPEWEKEYLKEKVINWALDGKSAGVNLGDYLGSVPSTVRKFPGAPNAYVTQYEMQKIGDDGTAGEPELLFEKVRSGAVIPFDIKNGESKARITKQNLEQLMADTIRRKMEGVKSGIVEVPMIIQTLFSPPIQPKGGDSVLSAAVAKLSKEMKDNPQGFLDRLGIEVPDGVTVKLGTDYVNDPVNNVRGLSSALNFFRRDRSGSPVSALSKFVGTDPEFASEVERQLRSPVWYGENIIAGSFAQSHNYNSERAALEQILNFAKGGNRIGSCVSGKDREEMVTEMAIAMVMFKNKNGHLPPPPGTESKERAEFEELVARQFLANHGQQIAASNSVGSNGLKNVDEVYGTSICDRIRELAKDDSTYPEFGGGKIDPIEQTKRSAGYNKPKPEKSTDEPYKGLKGAKKPGFFQKAISFLSSNPIAKAIYWGAAAVLTVFVPPVGITMLAVGAVVEGTSALRKLKAAASMPMGSKAIPDPIIPEREGLRDAGSVATVDDTRRAGVDSVLGNTYGNDLEQTRSAPAAVSGLPKVVRSPEAETPLAEIGRADPDPEHGLSMGVEEPRRPASSAPAVTKGPSAR